MNNRLDEKVYETIGAHLTADLIETQTRIRSRVNKTRTLLRFCPSSFSSSYHRNDKNIYVSFNRAAKMKRILCFDWLP